MKFGNQEFSILTNEFQYPGKEVINDKFNCLIDNIWNIPKHTNNNEQFVCPGHNLCSIQFLHNR